jgi:hypothetical protein
LRARQGVGRTRRRCWPREGGQLSSHAECDTRIDASEQWTERSMKEKEPSDCARLVH